MNYIKIFIFIAYALLTIPLKGQGGEGGTREIYTWTLNTGTTFRIHALGTVWGHNFEITTQYCGATLVDTSITVPSYNSGYSLGWDNVVLNCSPTNAPPYFGYGLYKVIIGNGRFLFYFDSRDCDYDGTYPCGNDFYFKYNYTYNSLQISTAGSCANINAVNGEYYNIWEIDEKIKPPTTNSFEDFWQNCLVLLPSQTGNHPRLVWGPHPDDNVYIDVTGYNIHRAIDGGSFSKIAEVNGTTYAYTDEYFMIGGSAQAHYKVTASWQDAMKSIQETSPTNIVTVGVGLYKDPGYSVEQVEFQLVQNYPNPFNPTTKINYSIKEKGLVMLKVYDILGKEIATLVNENKPAGFYEADFNASQLPSGMYIYKLQAGSFVQTRKMLMMK